MAVHSTTLLDCTLRDGGYYNAWDFPKKTIEDYLRAMKAAEVDVVELGFRLLENHGFKGPCAFTTDEFLESLSIPPELTVAVMVNGSDLCTESGCIDALERLFPRPAIETPAKIVRCACHFRELPKVLSVSQWLADRGYRVCFNVMQIADRTYDEVTELTRMASDWPIEVLYFADSTGSMSPDDTVRTISLLRENWDGQLGIHTHDNMGLALTNTLRAQCEGVTWLDATITGMGRGPGNARIEELVIEAEHFRGRTVNLVPLMSLIRREFMPLKIKYAWGTNPFYYLSGKYGIHPTYIQEMLRDSRYDEEDIFAVIDHLRTEGGKNFSFNTLSGARLFYQGQPRGSWKPSAVMRDREVLILGTGPGVAAHRPAIESFISRTRPLVIALNTQMAIKSALIDMRIACHPVRLLADAETHTRLPQPLITPASQLPDSLRSELGDKELLDFGLGISPGRFEFHEKHCYAPTSLVLAYALAAATSGEASRIFMAGFDGYPAGDPRNDEVESMLAAFEISGASDQLASITFTSYKGLPSLSLYGL